MCPASSLGRHNRSRTATSGLRFTITTELNCCSCRMYKANTIGHFLLPTTDPNIPTAYKQAQRRPSVLFSRSPIHVLDYAQATQGRNPGYIWSTSNAPGSTPHALSCKMPLTSLGLLEFCPRALEPPACPFSFRPRCQLLRACEITKSWKAFTIRDPGDDLDPFCALILSPISGLVSRVLSFQCEL